MQHSRPGCSWEYAEPCRRVPPGETRNFVFPQKEKSARLLRDPADMKWSSKLSHKILKTSIHGGNFAWIEHSWPLLKHSSERLNLKITLQRNLYFCTSYDGLQGGRKILSKTHEVPLFNLIKYKYILLNILYATSGWSDWPCAA